MIYGQAALPWVMPATVVFTVVGLLVCRRLAQALDTRPFVAWLLVVSLGIIASATITPLRGMFDTTPAGPETCDFSVLGPIPVRDLFRVNDRLLNVLLFVPLGVALGLLPGAGARPCSWSAPCCFRSRSRSRSWWCTSWVAAARAPISSTTSRG